jgi:hypothetical protein
MIWQPGRIRSTMPQAIAIAMACFRGIAAEIFTDSFIRFILEEFALAIWPNKSSAINSWPVQSTSVSTFSHALHMLCVRSINASFIRLAFDDPALSAIPTNQLNSRLVQRSFMCVPKGRPIRPASRGLCLFIVSCGL